jgi:serpin B
MKKAIAISLCLMMTASLLSACGDDTQMTDKEILSNSYTRSDDTDETYNYNDGAEDSPSSYTTYSSEIADFELKLFRNLYSDNSSSGSYATAPINSVLQLSLLANGASKDTQTEITNALGDDLTLEQIDQCSSYFKSRIEAVANINTYKTDELTGKKITSDGTSYVSLYNGYFFNDTSDVKTKFLQTNADYFGSDIFRFDFGGSNALSKLNTCFESYSENALEALDSSNSLLSITASDICDKWLETYAETDITEGIFNSSNGEESVKYMTSNESYIKTNTAQGVIKYLSKTPLKMLLIMPNEGVELDDYVKSLNYLEYENLLSSFDIKTKVTAKIPEFSVNSDGTAKSISDAVTKSGLYTLFTEDATFKNMTSSTELVLNDMCEITPQITVNAAGLGGKQSNDSSAVISERTTALDDTELTVEFNRPFIFMLIDNESNIPLYTGFYKSSVQ